MTDAGESVEPDAVLIHASANCESTTVGSGRASGRSSHVLPGAVIGRDCNICDQVFIENDVIVGDRVTVKSGVQLWDGVAWRTTCSWVPTRRSPTTDGRAVGRACRGPEYRGRGGASIGGNATILPDVTSGRGRWWAREPSSRVTCRRAIVYGNPAEIRGYADESGSDAGSRRQGGGVVTSRLGARLSIPLLRDGARQWRVARRRFRVVDDLQRWYWSGIPDRSPPP